MCHLGWRVLGSRAKNVRGRSHADNLHTRPVEVSLLRMAAVRVVALAVAAAALAWGAPGVALGRASARGEAAAARTADPRHGEAAKAQSINPSNFRIVLARTYLQTGGPKNIPLPSVTQVIGASTARLWLSFRARLGWRTRWRSCRRCWIASPGRSRALRRGGAAVWLWSES